MRTFTEYLIERANSTGSGYWKAIIQDENQTQWIPVFTGMQKETQITPGEVRLASDISNLSVVNNIASTIKFDEKTVPFYGVQAYNILPNNQTFKTLSGDIKQLVISLLHALKKRGGEKDYISDADFKTLMKNSMTNVSVKLSPLRTQNPKRHMIVIADSSSPVAKEFASIVQKYLQVPKSHVFTEHIQKRDAEDIYNDIAELQGVDEDRKNHFLTKFSNTTTDTGWAMKNMQRGARNEIRGHGVNFFEPSQPIKSPYKQIPNLIIVDDNMQTNATVKNIAHVVARSTGIIPHNVYGIAMFKYP
jgi:hypothetical protein